MGADYLWDRSGPVDPELAALERALGRFGQRTPPPEWRGGRPRRAARFFVALAAAAAIVVALVLVVARARIQPAAGFEVTRLAGRPTIGARPIDDRAPLPVGRWLETDDESRVRLELADAGRVDLDPRTRLRLISTRTGNYRLHLARGTMHAVIVAPPTAVSVETPSATAIDLGCMYTLTVDDEGVGLVTVTLGWVGFEWRGRESFIPTGAEAFTRPGLGPGTPHFRNASPAFREALAVIDRQGGSPQRFAALSLVLSEAQPQDTLTLWHLLTRVDVADRDRVFDRLAGFVPPPAGVTREGIRGGDRAMLDAWWDALGFGTSAWWRVWKQQWR